MHHEGHDSAGPAATGSLPNHEEATFEPIKVILCDVANADDIAAKIKILAADAHPKALVYVRNGLDLVDSVHVDLTSTELDALFEGLRTRWHRDIEPARPRVLESTPLVTVVVPTIMQRSELLQRLLDSLSALEYPNFEVVIVDNRTTSSPLPSRMSVLDERMRVVREPVRGISAARNCGVAHARGEIIAFTDDDARVDPLWLNMLVDKLQSDPELSCVTGIGLPDELETAPQVWFERYYGGFSNGLDPKVYRLLKSHPGAMSNSVVGEYSLDGELLGASPLLIAAGHCGVGVNMAFRATALAFLGPFDQSLGAGTRTRGGEEISAFARLLWAGKAIGYEPRALVWHTHRRSYEELARQVEGTGTSITATLLALALSDRRLALRLVASTGVPQRTWTAVRTGLLRSSRTPAAPASAPLYPAELRSREVRGMLQGPLAYLRERWARRPHKP